MVERNCIFENFSEYWYFTGFLDEEQRDTIFKSLSQEQQKQIQKSYRQGGWEDLFMRNHIDKMLDELKREHNIDLLMIKSKVMSGKSHYTKKAYWNFIVDMFNSYEKKHKDYILGGIDAEVVNSDTVLLKPCIK